METGSSKATYIATVDENLGFESIDGSNFVVYVLDRTTTVTPDPKIAQCSMSNAFLSTEGVADINNVLAYMSGKVQKIEDSTHRFYSKRLVEYIGRENGNDYDLWKTDVCSVPYTAYRTEPDAWTLVWHNSYDGMLYDAHGEHLPVARNIGYIGFNLDNQHYRLEDAAAILYAHPDFTPTLDCGDVAKTPLDLIKDIPYYNRDEKRNRSIEGVWHPSTDTYREVMALAKTMCNGERKTPDSWTINTAMKKLDVLGLRFAAKRKEVKTYYGQ